MFAAESVESGASRKLSPVWYGSSALVVRRKQASEFVLIRGYTIKQLNTLMVTLIV